MDDWKKLKLPKVVKGCLKFSFFFRVYKLIELFVWEGLARVLKKVLNFDGNELRF